ncbi:unnamed protein product [Larinioides sclopetarius]|uniref:Uncharacterized protein n=1 Tax=Larinioides sclopetarius TaxID=280406 RepID=A0AAV1Z397_9ARAC
MQTCSGCNGAIIPRAVSLDVYRLGVELDESKCPRQTSDIPISMTEKRHTCSIRRMTGCKKAA